MISFPVCRYHLFYFGIVFGNFQCHEVELLFKYSSSVSSWLHLKCPRFCFRWPQTMTTWPWWRRWRCSSTPSTTRPETTWPSCCGWRAPARRWGAVSPGASWEDAFVLPVLGLTPLPNVVLNTIWRLWRGRKVTGSEVKSTVLLLPEKWRFSHMGQMEANGLVLFHVPTCSIICSGAHPGGCLSCDCCLQVWFDRRTNYTRSLAVMSMVGYILGLGDRWDSVLEAPFLPNCCRVLTQLAFEGH